MKRRTVKPTKICIHHSLTADNVTLSDTAAIRRYHTSYRYKGKVISKEEFERLALAKAKGLEGPWSDIGYHYLVERVKLGVKIEIGRPIGYEGAHCTPINATSIGICLVGNYDLAPPDKEMLDALAKLVRELMDEYRIPVAGVHFHSDFSTKSCPGKLFPRVGFLLACADEVRP